MSVFHELVEDCVAEVEWLMALYPPTIGPDDEFDIDAHFTAQLIVAMQKFAWDCALAGKQGRINSKDLFGSGEESR